MSEILAKKAGFVAIIGKPNSGKSTLMNNILGQEISIVSPKPQTTRNKILGIHTTDNMQVIFLDTPGILKPGYKLQQFMKKEIESSLIDSDLILVVIDASDFDENEISKLFENFEEELKKFRIIGILNKI